MCHKRQIIAKQEQVLLQKRLEALDELVSGDLVGMEPRDFQRIVEGTSRALKGQPLAPSSG